MFKFLAALLPARSASPDVLLARDEDYWDTVHPERFARVVETQTHIVGFAADGSVAARVRKPECIGVTHDWDAGLDIDCPDHPGVFCPGGSSTFYR